MWLIVALGIIGLIFNSCCFLLGTWRYNDFYLPQCCAGLFLQERRDDLPKGAAGRDSVTVATCSLLWCELWSLASCRVRRRRR
jgi:hypothetical protein